MCAARLSLPELAHAQEGLEEEAAVPLARMEYGIVGQSYVLLRREAGAMALGKLGTTLQFTVKEIDPASGAQRSALRGVACSGAPEG